MGGVIITLTRGMGEPTYRLSADSLSFRASGRGSTLFTALHARLRHMLHFDPSLVPRPHPLTRRNGLVNQVEFLGLAHTFATM